MKKRILSLLLAFAMAATLAPATSLVGTSVSKAAAPKDTVIEVNGAAAITSATASAVTSGNISLNRGTVVSVVVKEKTTGNFNGGADLPIGISVATSWQAGTSGISVKGVPTALTDGASQATAEFELETSGTAVLASGTNTITITLTDKNSTSENYVLNVTSIADAAATTKSIVNSGVANSAVIVDSGLGTGNAGAINITGQEGTTASFILRHAGLGNFVNAITTTPSWTTAGGEAIFGIPAVTFAGLSNGGADRDELVTLNVPANVSGGPYVLVLDTVAEGLSTTNRRFYVTVTVNRAGQRNVTLDLGGSDVSGVNNGWVKNGSTATQNVRNGEQVTLPTPTRPGYTFNGWTNSVDSTMTAGGSTSNYITSDITFTANWTETKLSIRYEDAIGAASAKTQQISLVNGGTLDANAYTRTGYTFEGWSYLTAAQQAAADDFEIIKDKSTVSGLKARDMDVANNGARDRSVTLYAVWAPIEYKINFNANAPEGKTAKGTMEPQTKEYGTNITLTHNKYLVDGYRFMGWALTPNGTRVYGDANAQLTDASFVNGVVSGSVTLYGVWQEIVNEVLITYYEDVAGTTILKYDYAAPGSTYSLLPTDVSAAKLNQTGWALIANSTPVGTTYTIPQSSSGVSFFPVGTPRQYTITYSVNVPGFAAATQPTMVNASNPVNFNYSTTQDVVLANPYIGAAVNSQTARFTGWTLENLRTGEVTNTNVIPAGAIGNYSATANFLMNYANFSATTPFTNPTATRGTIAAITVPRGYPESQIKQQILNSLNDGTNTILRDNVATGTQTGTNEFIDNSVKAISWTIVDGSTTAGPAIRTYNNTVAGTYYFIGRLNFDEKRVGNAATAFPEIACAVTVDPTSNSSWNPNALYITKIQEPVITIGRGATLNALTEAINKVTEVTLTDAKNNTYSHAVSFATAGAAALAGYDPDDELTWPTSLVSDAMTMVSPLPSSWPTSLAFQPASASGVQNNWTTLRINYVGDYDPGASAPSEPTVDPIAAELAKAKELLAEGYALRVFNPIDGNHYYYTRISELETLLKIGCKHEVDRTAQFKASETQTATFDRAVYRLMTKNAGGAIHYTADAKERDNLVKLGWTWDKANYNAEGAIFYVSGNSGNAKIYRLRNGKMHHFALQKERDYLINKNIGWVDETGNLAADKVWYNAN